MPTAKRREKEEPRRKKRKDREAAAARSASASASGKRQKRLKLQAHLRIAGAVRTPGALSARPFEALAEDHCETPFQAFRDIEPLLFALAARLKKPKADLRIYDPFYCEGSMVEHLNALGFASVYNRNEDFYEVRRRGAVPDHDVVVTNPPFSGEHIVETLRFCAQGNGGRPFLLLLPNFVFKKQTFAAAVRGAEDLFYLVPASRYTFWSPGRSKVTGPPRKGSGEGGGAGGAPASTAPFECMWYVHLGGFSEDCCLWYRKKFEPLNGCCLARTAAELPASVVPKRTVKRSNPRARARLKAKMKAAGKMP